MDFLLTLSLLRYIVPSQNAKVENTVKFGGFSHSKLAR